MKIALFTDGIPPFVIGGMQKHSFYLAKYLAKRGVELDLYHPEIAGGPDNVRVILNCFSDDEKNRIRIFTAAFPKGSSFPGHYLKESYEYSGRVYSLFLKNREVDFVYAKGFTGWKFIQEKMKGQRLPEIGVNFHGYEMFQQAPGFIEKLKQQILRTPVKYLTQHADVVFSYGGKITEIIKALQVPASGIIEAPAGISTDWAGPAGRVGNPLTFVFVGRYERRKGLTELMNALRILNKSGKKDEFRFLFVGDIPESKRFVSARTFYYGKVSDMEKLKKILQDADVLVCPSYAEGMPNSILEGMAMGLAVIATDVGAVSEMVSSENGILLPEVSAQAIAGAMDEFIKMPAEYLLAKKTASLNKSRNFLWENVIDRTLSQIQLKIAHG